MILITPINKIIKIMRRQEGKFTHIKGDLSATEGKKKQKEINELWDNLNINQSLCIDNFCQPKDRNHLKWKLSFLLHHMFISTHDVQKRFPRNSIGIEPIFFLFGKHLKRIFGHWVKSFGNVKCLKLIWLRERALKGIWLSLPMDNLLGKYTFLLLNNHL